MLGMESRFGLLYHLGLFDLLQPAFLILYPQLNPCPSSGQACAVGFLTNP